MMCMFVYLNTSLHPTLYIFLMDISELCVSLTSICPSLDVSGSFVNSNLYYLVDIILPPFVGPTVIGGVFSFFFIWFACFDIISSNHSIFYSFLGYIIVSWVDPAELA